MLAVVVGAVAEPLLVQPVRASAIAATNVAPTVNERTEATRKSSLSPMSRPQVTGVRRETLLAQPMGR